MRLLWTSAVALAIGLGLGPGTAALAVEPHDLEALVLELATTPAQHHAVAAHYRAQAEEARQEAARHRSMGKTYGGGKFVLRQQMQKHCDDLAAEYDALAKQYDQLAKLHDQEAGAE